MTYRSKRKAYEEQEDELQNEKSKAVSIIEEIQDRSHYYLKSAVPDNQTLKQGYLKTEQMKDEVVDLIQEELREISRKMEDLDEDYYSKSRK